MAREVERLEKVLTKEKQLKWGFEAELKAALERAFDLDKQV